MYELSLALAAVLTSIPRAASNGNDSAPTLMTLWTGETPLVFPRHEPDGLAGIEAFAPVDWALAI